MTADVVIHAERLGKKYLIGHQTQRERYTALRDVIARSAKNLGRSALDVVRGGQLVVGDEVEEFWALEDVDFEIRRGDVVGIIGGNGAGKSTLLKILSRITEPSAGRVEIAGRVASLLEVGTGFHPELTGRENIFLNGAILGMSRAETRRKFDEIVGFAEIERFLDTPVKRYSSGMYVRLAFAVAAHLEPEILVVDEVLAVGDAEFQRKCLGKMGEVAGGGRTVLFVSHSMPTVAKLCNAVMLLDRGTTNGVSKNVDRQIRTYLRSDDRLSPEWVGEAPAKCPWIQVHRAHATQTDREDEIGEFTNDNPIKVTIAGCIEARHPALTFGIAVYSTGGELLFWSYLTDGPYDQWPKLEVGFFEVCTHIPPRLLNAGRYRVEIIGGLHYQYWLLEPGRTPVHLTIEIVGGLSDSPIWSEPRPGLLAPVLEWQPTGRH